MGVFVIRVLSKNNNRVLSKNNDNTSVNGGIIWRCKLTSTVSGIIAKCTHTFLVSGVREEKHLTRFTSIVLTEKRKYEQMLIVESLEGVKFFQVVSFLYMWR